MTVSPISRLFLSALCALCVLIGSAACASPPAALPQGNAHLQPFDSLRYLLTDTDALDPDAAMARQSEFSALTSPWVDFGKQDGAVWLLVRVENTGPRAGEWMIDIQRPFVDDLIVQKRSGDVSETLLAFDRTMPFEARPVVSQYLVAPLWMEAGERADILVGLKSSTGSWMPLTFATSERMRTAHMQEARFNWAINGAMAAMVLVALAMGRLVGWPLVLAFAAYVSLSALFVANNEGYLHRFVWPDNMGAYEPANLILLTAMMIAVLQFARLFAVTATARPKVNTAVIMLQIALIGLLVASTVLWPYDAMRLAVFAAVPFVALAYFLVAVLAWRSQVLGAVPFIAGSIAILFTVAVMSAVMLAPGQVPLTIALDYFHASVLFESLAFLVAILVRMLSIQSDLNRSLEAQIVTAREKLELSEALRESQTRYDRALTQANTLRGRLASASHDLQQPLLSLRHSLSAIVDRDPEVASKLSTALDYLKDVTETGLKDAAGEAEMAGEEPASGAETFEIGVVLSNCAAMFEAEAKRKGIQLRVRPSALKVCVEPVDLMRAVSNLVSNALKHSGASKILVAAQARHPQVLIRVIDNGCGMSDEALLKAQRSGEKGAGSEGHGLGLALAISFAEQDGHSVSIRSAPDQGTCIALGVPSG